MARNRKIQPGQTNGLTPQQKHRLERQVQQTLKQAVRHHTAGRLKKAEPLYRQILRVDPANTHALHLLGVVRHQYGDNEGAVDLISQAIAINPEFGDAYSNMGNALMELDRIEEALDCYFKAVTLMPEMAEAHNNIGNALKSLGRVEESLESYRIATAIRPDFAEAHNNHGSALQDLGRLRESLACYRQAIAIRPDYADAYGNLGSAYREMGETDNAVESYRTALQLDPENPDNQANLTGLHISDLEDGTLALGESRKSLTLWRGRAFGTARDETTVERLAATGIPYFRLKHDVQQADYLASKGVELAGIEKFRIAGRDILEEHEGGAGAEDPAPIIHPTFVAARDLLPYLQTGHLRDIGDTGDSVLNPDKNWREVEQEYLDSANEVIHIDGFLSDPALAALRDFCLESKVWLKDYPNKYLGAFSDCGFLSPLHLQIARELRQKLPTVFGPHPLGRSWGFKYDATLGKGINVHADFALVNLNFWITPDPFNTDENSGGLVVYDVPSPRNWHFKAYNADKDAIYGFLKEHRANSIRIPHRCNRAVLFNSAYFHETDAIHFLEGYESRRINITYLFGKR